MSAKNAKKMRREKIESDNSLQMSDKEFMNWVHASITEKYPNIPYEILDKVVSDKGIESCTVDINNVIICVFSNIKRKYEPTLSKLLAIGNENEMTELLKIPTGKKKHIFKSVEEETEYWKGLYVSCNKEFPNCDYKFGDVFMDDDGKLTCRVVAVPLSKTA